MLKGRNLETAVEVEEGTAAEIPSKEVVGERARAVISRQNSARLPRVLVYGLPAIALFSVAILAHLRVVAIGEEYKGLFAPLDRVFDLLLSLSLISVTFCVGRKVCNRLSVQFTSLTEELSFSIMIGTGVVGLLLLGLGLVGLFKPLPMLLFFVVLLAVTHREVWRWFGVINELMRRALKKENRLLALLFIAILAVLVIRAEVPPTTYDDAICHLAVPRAYIEAGRILPLYDNITSNVPFLMQMFYVVCLMAKSEIAASLFSLSIGITTGVAVYAFCARFLNRKTALVALFSFFAAGMVIEVAITNRIDISLSGMLFVATSAMMTYFETGHRSWFYISCLCSGFSLDIKYTAAVWVAVIGILFIFESFSRKHDFAGIIMKSFAFTLIALALASPWLIKNYTYFKNPFYPLVTGEVATYGSQGLRYFTPEDEEKIETYYEESKGENPQNAQTIERLLSYKASRRPERHTFRVWEYFTNPELYEMGDADKNHSPNYLFMIVPLCLFLPQRRWLNWLGIFSIIFFCFIASSAWLARYQLPIYPAMTVLAAYVLVTLVDKFSAYVPIAGFLPSICVGIAVLSALFVFALPIYTNNGIGFITGMISRRDYLQVAQYFPALDFINYHTPKDARVLMVGMQTGYHLRRNYIADPGWDAAEWQRLMIRNNSFEEIHQDLKRQGINYIVLNHGLFTYTAFVGRAGSGPAGVMYNSPVKDKNAPDYLVQLRNWVTFDCYQQQYLELLFEKNNTLVFRLE